MTITEPGIYDDLPNDVYHSQTEWLSSTQLKALLPEHYRTGGSQDALDFGTLFHTAVLEPEKLSEYVPLDAASIGVKADGTPAQNPTMTAAWKRAVAEVESDGKRVVAQADLDRALAMRDAVARHDVARRLLMSDDGVSEQSVFVEDADGLRHKARFDRVVPGVITDLKSTSKGPGRQAIARAVIDLGYDVSCSHYLTVAELAGIEVQAFAFVFVTKEPPHYVTVTDLDDNFLARGAALRQQAIRRHINPAEPRYDGATGFLTLACPRWAEMEMTA